ncbi:hypothetical protein MMC22_011980 [Lobaria immixta]|nr:hypothetical protein [Lobaria immixta]
MTEGHSVVFSYWTKTLDPIESELRLRSIRYTRLDGQLPLAKRSSALQTFQSNPEVLVFLVSLSCGGVGLDLTAASKAYTMEPQWNPMSEEQALDRIPRLGQTKEVTTVRYIIKDSFEEVNSIIKDSFEEVNSIATRTCGLADMNQHIIALQRKKKDLAELALFRGPSVEAPVDQSRLQYLRSLLE